MLLDQKIVGVTGGGRGTCRLRIWLTVGLLAFLAGHTASASKLERQYPPGTPISNPVVVGKKQIPLPPGQWTVAGVRSSRNSELKKILDLFLIDVKSGVLQHAASITTNMSPPKRHQGWLTHSTCSSKSSLHLVTKSSSEGEDQECWWVRYWPTSTPPKKDSAWKRALDFAITQGIELPTNFVTVGYRLADDAHFLNVYYLFSPEVDGIVSPGRTAQNPSVWHVDRFGRDPKKVEYVNRLKTWGASWLANVKAGFKGRLKN